MCNCYKKSNWDCSDFVVDFFFVGAETSLAVDEKLDLAGLDHFGNRAVFSGRAGADVEVLGAVKAQLTFNGLSRGQMVGDAVRPRLIQGTVMSQNGVA